MMKIDGNGLVAEALQVPSPNCDARPRGAQIELLVIHCISLPPGEFGRTHIDRLFTNRLDPADHPYFRSISGLRVSAHFLVVRDGGLVQYVPCSKRAWHAGMSHWGTRTACNDFSVGIELEGTETGYFEPGQYATLAALVRSLGRKYPIRSVLGHSDIAPGRKSDPGVGFDWPLLRSLIHP